MESVIQNNLQEAQRGGVPGTMSLIEAYLNVRLDGRFQYEVRIRDSFKLTVFRTEIMASIRSGHSFFFACALAILCWHQKWHRICKT
jgi:hypothetical protein